jgi:hypothetical protein
VVDLERVEVIEGNRDSRISVTGIESENELLDEACGVGFSPGTLGFVLEELRARRTLVTQRPARLGPGLLCGEFVELSNRLGNSGRSNCSPHTTIVAKALQE